MTVRDVMIVSLMLWAAYLFFLAARARFAKVVERVEEAGEGSGGWHGIVGFLYLFCVIASTVGAVAVTGNSFA